MFPMLNNLKLEFTLVILSSLMHFSAIIRFLIEYAIGCDSRSIILCEIAPSHNIRSPAQIRMLKTNILKNWGSFLCERACSVHDVA